MKTPTLLLVLVAACGGKQSMDSTPAAATQAADTATQAAEAATQAKAGAALEPRSGSNTTGMVTITPMDGGLHVEVRVANATPGKHGIHFH